jgi:hypothetical protein
VRVRHLGDIVQYIDEPLKLLRELQEHGRECLAAKRA